MPAPFRDMRAVWRVTYWLAILMSAVLSFFAGKSPRHSPIAAALAIGSVTECLIAGAALWIALALERDPQPTERATNAE